jgi:hypothetical protein
LLETKPTAVTDWNEKPYALKDCLGAADTSRFEFCGVTPGSYNAFLSLVGNATGFFQTTKGFLGWAGLKDYYSAVISPQFQKVVQSGLETVMGNLASSLSLYARNISSATVSGTSKTPAYYVVVNWAWLTLPALLVVCRVVLLVSTTITNTHRKAGLQKSSVLPFLYHGLEDSLLEKNGVESASQMEHAAGKVKAYLSSSDMESRWVLRGGY